ncbi:serine hydrolase [Sediminibacillus dalangtanensis]|uniref:Serine hydrolase n=1 Tax=Sediminibacillus dalangtanensis TaxID=2729421 RepID=A0ABX7VUF2_9BACI|nr:serine hydrolase domain-containing protein [Sediminibacillus dalangtanensis]QTM99103.1 serine hydrolase [Sediminibacillus dalangtanensis]
MRKQLTSLVEQSTVPGMSLAIIEKYNLQTTECFGVTEAGANQWVKPETLFSACSISKFVTAMLVMKFAGRGILDLDEDVNRKLVSWKVPESPLIKTSKVTLRKLLSHQAGIKDPKESFGPLNEAEGFPLMQDVLTGKTAYCPYPVHVKEKPGGSFHYSDTAYCIIQLLIEDVTEKSFETIIKEELFEPLRMKNSTYTVTEGDKLSSGHDKVGRTVNGKYPVYPFPAAAGLWTTPTDLSLILKEFLLAATGKSTLVLSHSLAEEMLSPQGCAPFSGLGVFLDWGEGEKEISSFGWGIGFQSMLVAYPSLGTGAVIMTNANLGVHQLKGVIGQVYKQLLPQLTKSY